MKIKSCLGGVLFLLLCSFSSYPHYVKIKDNEIIALNEDGTWEQAFLEICEKSKSATKLFRSSKTKAGIWIDPKHWDIKEKKINKNAEFTFKAINEDIVALMFNYQYSLSLDEMQEEEVSNLKESDKDFRVLSEEKKLVNGLLVKCVEAESIVEDHPIKYLFYFYSGENEMVELITIFYKASTDKPKAEEFMNGIVQLR